MNGGEAGGEAEREREREGERESQTGCAVSTELDGSLNPQTVRS